MNVCARCSFHIYFFPFSLSLYLSFSLSVDLSRLYLYRSQSCCFLFSWKSRYSFVFFFIRSLFALLFILFLFFFLHFSFYCTDFYFASNCNVVCIIFSRYNSNRFRKLWQKRNHQYIHIVFHRHVFASLCLHYIRLSWMVFSFSSSFFLAFVACRFVFFSVALVKCNPVQYNVWMIVSIELIFKIRTAKRCTVSICRCRIVSYLLIHDFPTSKS